jgi:hypothetical protein
MRKKSFIAVIILTILNIFPTIFCAILNSGIVYEGEGSIGLIVIVPYSFILIPTILLLLILSLVFVFKSLKSDNNKIHLFSIILLVINVIIALTLIIMIARLIPLFFK